MSQAVLFGIQNIQGCAKLKGCYADVVHMRTFIAEQMNYDSVSVYTDSTTPDMVTGRNMLNILWNLAIESYAKSLERVCIFFSGHGPKHEDEAIMPLDYLQHGNITNPEFNQILSAFNPSTKVFCIIDSCHSGSTGSLPYTYNRRDARRPLPAIHPPKMKSNIVLFSACKFGQRTYDGLKGTGGIFTTCLINCLTRRIKNKLRMSITAITEDLFTLIRKTSDQTPVITSSQQILENTMWV